VANATCSSFPAGKPWLGTEREMEQRECRFGE
jgi:hypothetical protein